MSDLRLPLDFERTHEFRLLVNELKTRANGSGTEKTFEASAVYIYLRLFVELAFLARTTNRPGYLTKSGKLLFESSLEPMFGADASPAEILKAAMILEVPQAGDEEDLYCPVFAQFNEHTAGNYTSKEVRGNRASQYERQKNRTAHEALQQALTLSPEIFRKREGGVMTEVEIQRAMVFIKTLDNALGNQRSTKQYSESLVADAFTVSSKYAREADVLKKMFMWIMNNRTNPALPKTTEQILSQFEVVEKLTRQ